MFLNFVINSECLRGLLLLMLSCPRLAMPHPPGLQAPGNNWMPPKYLPACLPALEHPGLFRMLLELIIWGKLQMDISTHDSLGSYKSQKLSWHLTDTSLIWLGSVYPVLAWLVWPGGLSQQEAALAALSPGVTPRPPHLWRPPPCPLVIFVQVPMDHKQKGYKTSANICQLAQRQSPVPTGPKSWP